MTDELVHSFKMFGVLILILVIGPIIVFIIYDRIKHYSKNLNTSTMTIFKRKGLCIDAQINPSGWVLPFGISREYKKLHVGFLCIFFTVYLR